MSITNPTFTLTVLLAFLCGALPFSVWIGRFALGKDIRQFGDGNPGATNVGRAGGGKVWTALAIILDFLKGAIPIAIVHYGWQWAGWEMALVALAPVLGHAFSPFLNWRGGKALAVTFGVWTGLTTWIAPVALGILFALFLYFVATEGVAVILGMAGLILILTVTGVADATIWLFWLGNISLLAWTHRHDLSRLFQQITKG